MVKIIETNISMGNNSPQDVQSRVIEVSSWENYMAEINDNQSVYRSCVIGTLVGESRSMKYPIDIMTQSENSLIYKVTLFDGTSMLKTAYLV